MHRLVIQTFAVGMVCSTSCNKTVISDRVVPIETPTTTIQPPHRSIGDGIPDTKAILYLKSAKCNAERKTSFSVKVAGLKNTDWVPLTCSDKDKKIEINTKKGYCNVLQLRAEVSFEKNGQPKEQYVRSTSNGSDRDFFKADEKSNGTGSTQGLNIHFEDTNDNYWNNAYQLCKKNLKQTIDIEPITGIKNQSCKNILEGYKLSDGTAVEQAVDWNDFEFSVESDQILFTVEGFPSLGCSPK